MSPKRKIIYAVSGVLLVFELGLSGALISAGSRRLSPAFEGIAFITSVVREYARPIPRLDRWL